MDPTETPVHILKYIHIYPKNEHYSIVYNNEVWEQSKCPSIGD